jgi:hypothetical protein
MAVSTRLAEYTRSIRTLAPFLALAESLHYRPLFTVTSALGQSPTTGPNGARLAGPRAPYRVADPFLLTLALDPRPRLRLALVLDATGEAGPLYEAKLHEAFWEAIRKAGTATTYYLGEKSRTDHFPIPPRPRLVGPILDALGPETRVLVVANGPTYDLNDYLDTWAGRVVVVRLDNGPAEDRRWPVVRFAPGDDPEAAVRRLIDLSSPDGRAR